MRLAGFLTGNSAKGRMEDALTERSDEGRGTAAISHGELPSKR